MSRGAGRPRTRTAAGVGRLSSRAGFTLLELMVAMVIGGVTLTAAAALYLGLASRADAIEAASRAASHDANGERLLRILAANVEPRGNGGGVRGDGASVALDTRCESALGWAEPCRVRLAFQAGGAHRHRLLLWRLAPSADSSPAPFADPPADVSAEGTPGMVLRDSVREGRFVYLVDASHGGSWSAAWTETPAPPAFAVVMDGDTLLLPVR